MLFFFRNLSFVEFPVSCLSLFLHLLVIDVFQYLMERDCKNIQLMPVFFIALFLVRSYTFLIAINDLSGIIFIVPIYSDDTTFYSKRDQASHFCNESWHLNLNLT